MATKESAASESHRASFFSARRPIRTTACEHDGEHRRLEAEEERRHEADIAEERVDPAQRHDGDDAGQNEQDARDQAARVRCRSQPI